MGPASPAAFAPRPDDDDDVRWALSTALVQWNRGGRADAVVWLRRAGEAAAASGAPARAEELRQYAARLAETLWAQPGEDIDVEVDVASEDRRAPLPPPPAAVRAIQERVQPLPSVPPLAPRDPDRQSIAELEPVREHYASAPEIVLDEEALDPSELEEILDYVGEDDLLEEVVPSRTARTSTEGHEEFSDRLSSASVEPLEVESVLPEIDADAGALASSPGPADRVSETEVFDLRPSHADGVPERRAPAVALPQDDDEFEDDRVTVIPLGDEAVGAPEGGADASAESFASEWDPPVPPADPLPEFGSLPPGSEPTELLDGEAALAIDADLGASYRPESIDLGADWAPMESERASALEVPMDELAPVSLEVSELEVVEAVIEPSPEQELDSVVLEPPPESLPPLEFPSEPPHDLPAPPSGPRATSRPPPSGPPESSAMVDGMDLMTARGFEDLPEEVQEQLARSARVESLAAGEEAGLFGAAIVTHGEVAVLPAFADEAGAVALQSDVVFTRGTLDDSIALRVVARIDGTRVAVWDPQPLAEAIEACPWVHDELRLIADRFLARCGATLGPLGERLDDSLRSAVFDRMEVRTFAAGEELTVAGEPLPGLFVVGGGRVEVLEGDAVREEMNPGDFLFAMAMMGGAKSPATARAGEKGALVLFAPRGVAHELMISVPPLLEVLAG